jgi:hypothetical protein
MEQIDKETHQFPSACIAQAQVQSASKNCHDIPVSIRNNSSQT